MSKSDVSAMVVAFVGFIAFVVVRELRRRRDTSRAVAPMAPEAPAGEVSLEVASQTAAQPQALAPVRTLSARERRHEEIRDRASSERCLYCAATAEVPLPYARFSHPSLDVAAVITGDLPKHWRVRAPSSIDLTPVLCRSHGGLARSAVELRIARSHAEYVAFVASQLEELHEFTLHGLDEAMRAEAERVRKGASRNGGAV